MSDDLDPVSMASHGTVAAVVAFVTAWLSRLFESRESRELLKQMMALLNTQVAATAEALKVAQQMSAQASELADMRKDLKALHERLDGSRAPRG